MAEIIRSPRGTQDIMPDASYRWQYVEGVMRSVVERFGYSEIRVPTFEHTELFDRGVGDTTDIVGKEMYTMNDRAGRSITLRPEGTASVVRSFIQNGVLSGALPAKAYYILPCFRYEKPQAGRLREFHQLGIEMFGAYSPDADAEVIKTASTILNSFGLKNIKLEINSIGCPTCRKHYHEVLKEYFRAHYDDLCDTCKDRLERNPLRILDCKSPVCAEIAADAPSVLEYLCDDCSAHFNELKNLLDEAGIEYTVNPKIVRGLDYYSRTVFEFVHKGAGAQGTVCGGGRYDGLVEYLGGSACAGIGFGLGIERLLSVIDSEGIEIPKPHGPDVFFCYIGDEGKRKARSLTFELQKAGYYALYDLNARSLKAQFKYSDKLDSRYTVTIGDGEIESGSAALRNMSNRQEQSVELTAEAIINMIK